MIWPRALAAAAVALAGAALAAAHLENGFAEEVAMLPLGGGVAAAHLRFSASAPAAAAHLGAFPAAAHALAAEHGVRSLRVTLARGRWRRGAWGGDAPGWLGAPPPGLEVDAEFDADAVAAADVPAAFAALAAALGGLSCTAAGSAAATGLVAEAPVWEPGLGAGGDGRAGGRRRVRASMPQEAACIENLGAWRALLPCRGQAGASALLRDEDFLGSPFHALGLELSMDGPPGDARSAVHLTLAATAVLPAPAGWPPARGAAAACEALFGRPPPPTCGAAASSSLLLVGGGDGGCAPAPGGWLACRLEAAPAGAELTVDGHVSQSATGGCLQLWVTLGGGGANATGGAGAPPALVHVLQLLPWQAPPLLHTARLAAGGVEAPVDAHPAVAWRRLRPATGRGGAAAVELLLRLPAAGGAARLALDFRKPLLSVFDYPPDASRGFDIPAAAAALAAAGCAAPPGGAAPGALLPRLRGGGAPCAAAAARGPAHVAQPPIPDASMPFNVACFTSTALAVLLGGALGGALSPPGAPAAARRGLRARARRLAAALVLVAALAVYLDRDVQRRAEAALAALAGGGGAAARGAARPREWEAA